MSRPLPRGIIQQQLGPWSYFAGSVYDLGRHDLVALGVKTYAEAEAHPKVQVQPSIICTMPEPGCYLPDLTRTENERFGRLIATLPDLLTRNRILEAEVRELRQRLRAKDGSPIKI
jgi:hypothetical protein